jgi:FkbM family methyltransferase
MLKIKIVLFSILENFFSLFGLQILFSKKENMDKNLNIKNIIDVGVANGTDFLLKNYPKANYLFVEPYKKFHSNIENNLLKMYKGKLFKYAAHNKKELKNFYMLDVSSSIIKRNNIKYKAKPIIVKADRLDSILKKQKITKDSILKIDTEGNELNVLKGSTYILKKVNFLIIELRLKNVKTYNPNELISFIYRKNFIWDSIINVGYAKNGISYMDILFKKNKLN